MPKWQLGKVIEMPEKPELLYPLNTLIQELRLAGWTDEAEKLIEVLELVWSEDLVFTPERSNIQVLQPNGVKLAGFKI